MKPLVLRLAGALLVSLCVAACASTPKPRTDIALSDSALQAAELADAGHLAPLDMRKARVKRMERDVALKEAEYGRAGRYSREVTVLADLAVARARAIRSDQALAEARTRVRQMQQELQRVKRR